MHPTAQELLVVVLAKAAKHFGTQVILTTHSPSVVRALPNDARVIWMKDGEVQPDGNTSGRKLMGWGLLDKRVLLLTEDTKINMLRSLLSQWPDLERIVALWPLHGSAVVAEARSNCVTVRLSVVTSNEPAIRLYERAGFKTWTVDTNALYVNGAFLDEALMRVDFV